MPTPAATAPAALAPSQGLPPAAWAPLFATWALTLAATAGSLFMGEVMGLTPWVLCWYQRIAMYPLVLVLGLGLLDGDRRVLRYAMPLAAAGWLLAAYHCALFWGFVSESLVPCGKGGSCADAQAQVVAGVPIPLLSLLAFTALLGLMLLTRKRMDA